MACPGDFDGEPPRVPVAIPGPRLEGFPNGGPPGCPSSLRAPARGILDPRLPASGGPPRMPVATSGPRFA